MTAKAKSSKAELLGLLLEIHFLGTLVYVIAASALYRRVTFFANPIPFEDLHFLIAAVSVPTVIATVVLEKRQGKAFSRLIGRYFGYGALLLSGILFVVSLI